MKTIQIESYVTSDGKQFTDKAEAQAHDIKLKTSGEIQLYLDTLSKQLKTDTGEALSDRAMAMRTNIILAWEYYKAATEDKAPAVAAVK